MAKQKKFDLVKYILKKNNVQGEIIKKDIRAFTNLEYVVEEEFDMIMPVMVNYVYKHEDDFMLKYYTITDGNRFLIYPYKIEIPAVQRYNDNYIMLCDDINKKINKNAEKEPDDIMIILDKKVILIEDWYYDDILEYSTKVIELGTLTENDWNKLKLLGFKETVITDKKRQKQIRGICEKNKMEGIE